jgi:tetratricopeptide (TPR) repeat protein
MKIILLFTLSLLLASCSNHRLETIIENEKNDVLAGESFLRYSSKRFEVIRSRNNMIQTAVTYCHQGDISDGLAQLKKYLIQERKNPNYWNHIGTCYYLNNQLSKAKYYFEIALKMGHTANQKTSSFLPAYNNLGLVYIKLRSFDKALNHFKLADKGGVLVTPKFNMLQLYLKFGQLKKALKLSLVLYRLAPKDIDVISSLGTINLLQGKYKESKNFYDQIHKKYLEREDISGQYAIVLYKLGYYEDAKRMLQFGQYTQIKSIKKMRDSLSNIIERKLKLLKDSELIDFAKVNMRG